ncbi:hypothetical protein OH413_25790, partial [Salmonella enterica]|nr:hypothetical protein [Salmonella enterica]
TPGTAAKAAKPARATGEPAIKAGKATSAAKAAKPAKGAKAPAVADVAAPKGRVVTKADGKPALKTARAGKTTLPEAAAIPLPVETV